MLQLNAMASSSDTNPGSWWSSKFTNRTPPKSQVGWQVIRVADVAALICRAAASVNGLNDDPVG